MTIYAGQYRPAAAAAAAVHIHIRFSAAARASNCIVIQAHVNSNDATATALLLLVQHLLPGDLAGISRHYRIGTWASVSYTANRHKRTRRILYYYNNPWTT